ncbi:MAG: D-glycerate dehydrogenase [Candidatus Cloacimonetes bacterium 4572_55]|nr:MAG: D-glycerate dehydrogenase [Candidatus Cloacimonetes bacterium 4572_55]
MKVYVTRQIPQIGIDKLKQYHDVDVNWDSVGLSRDQFSAKFQEYDAIVTVLSDRIDRDLLSRADHIKVLANYAVGYDNIDLQAATEYRIPVTNTPGVLTESTAELAWTLMFAVARQVPKAEAFARAGRFEGWGRSLLMFLGDDLSHKTLGVVGAGRIGSAFARMSRGFDMKILFTANSPKPELEKKLNARQTDLEELLTQSDFVSLHCPLTPKTHHLINEKALQLMKKSAYLINTARGPVVDELALIDALKTGEIAGAGLDVYEWEPKIPEELRALDNVVLLPHIGSATVATRNRMAEMAADNVLAALRGEKPPNCLNPDIYS